jgi:glyoxylate reductase
MSSDSSLAPILVTRKLPASALTILRSIAAVELPETPLDAAALRGAVRGRTALVTLLTERVDEALLEAGRPTLKIVANVAVGIDNIDVAAAHARGVIVTNTPDVLTNSVAEFTWGLILAVARRMTEGERLLRRGGWRGWSLDLLTGTELRGKQLGIIGAGRIGRAVAAGAPGFGMRVVFGRDGARGSIDGHPVVSIDELLVSSDVVSLSVPLRADTHRLIDRAALARMKRTAFLINTARGPVVDEQAVAWALREGLIAGAALDVFEREPAVHPDLLTLENVVLTPHLGSATRETRGAMADLAARNVAAVLGGQPPLTPV